jgi:hypothetical protein
VQAKIVDQQGKPVEGVLAQVCGTDSCINGKTDKNGDVVTCNGPVCVPGIAPGQDLIQPAFKYGAGLTYAKFAFPLPSGADHNLGDVTIIPIDPPGSGSALAPGTSVSSNGVSLKLAPGSSIGLDLLTYLFEDEQQFRAVVFSPTNAPIAVDPSLNLELLVGTTPVETTICPAAELSVPNSEAWPANTQVEFFVHGVSIEEEWAPYAGWAKISDGAVSADGVSIVTAQGQGVPLLSVFGIRRK